MLMRNYLVSLTQHSKRFLTTLPKGASTSQGIPPPFPISQRSTVIEDLPTTSQVPWILPNEHRNVKLFSFPTLNKVALEMPMFPNIVEKVEPATDIIPINDPDSSKKTPMYANRRLIKVRKRMMKKYKKILRIRKKWTKLQKLHMEKKAKQERIFRARMAALLTELDTFDPMVYIKDTIKKAKRGWHTDLAPSGRKKYPHWSQLIALEELYDLPPTDPPNYIDKRAGLPPPEVAQEIDRLRQEYRKKYAMAPKSTESVGLKNDHK